jgi:hypothetical protein
VLVVSRMRSGSPAPDRVMTAALQAERSSTAEGCSRHARNVALVNDPNRGALPPRVSLNVTMRSACAHGSGLISTL